MKKRTVKWRLNIVLSYSLKLTKLKYLLLSEKVREKLNIIKPNYLFLTSIFITNSSKIKIQITNHRGCEFDSLKSF